VSEICCPKLWPDFFYYCRLCDLILSMVAVMTASRFPLGLILENSCWYCVVSVLVLCGTCSDLDLLV
jgi:hypothetical protein